MNEKVDKDALRNLREPTGGEPDDQPSPRLDAPRWGAHADGEESWPDGAVRVEPADRGFRHVGDDSTPGSSVTSSGRSAVVDTAGENEEITGPYEILWLENEGNFGRIKPHLEKLCEAIPQFGLTLSGICADVLRGGLRVWVVGDFDAVLLTRLYQQQNGRIMCAITYAGGSQVISRTEPILERIEAYARLNGAFAVEIMGRPGWQRVTRGAGYSNIYVGVFKEL